MATPTRVESLHNGNGGGSTAVTTAPGTAVDDIVLLFIGSGANTLANALAPTSSPAISWQLIDSAELSGGGSHLRAYWGKVTSGGACTVTANSNGGYNTLLAAHVLRGADTTNPIDVGDVVTVDPATTSPQSPSVNASSADGRLFCAAFSGDASSSTYNSPPSLMTDHGSDSQFGTLATASIALTASGATGLRTWGFGNSRRFLTASVVVLGPSGKTVALDLITETGTAFAVGRAKAKGLSLVTETGTPLGVSGRKNRTILLLSETGLVLPPGAVKSRGLSLVTETGSVLALAGRKAKTLPLVTETGTVLPLDSGQETATGEPNLAYVRPGPAVYRRAISAAYRRPGILTYRRR